MDAYEGSVGIPGPGPSKILNARQNLFRANSYNS